MPLPLESNGDDPPQATCLETITVPSYSVSSALSIAATVYRILGIPMRTWKYNDTVTLLVHAPNYEEIALCGVDGRLPAMACPRVPVMGMSVPAFSLTEPSAEEMAVYLVLGLKPVSYFDIDANYAITVIDPRYDEDEIGHLLSLIRRHQGSFLVGTLVSTLTYAVSGPVAVSQIDAELYPHYGRAIFDEIYRVLGI
jgi:hypothetical protein